MMRVTVCCNCQRPVLIHADELPTRAGPEALDRLRFRDFLRDVYKREYPESAADLMRLLQNLNLATGEGQLNLAAVLMFADRDHERSLDKMVWSGQTT